MVTSAMNPMDYNQEMSRSVVQLGKKRVSSLCLPQATWHCNVVLRQQPVASAFLQVQPSALYSQIHVGVHAHVRVSAATDPRCGKDCVLSFPRGQITLGTTSIISPSSASPLGVLQVPVPWDRCLCLLSGHLCTSGPEAEGPCWIQSNPVCVTNVPWEGCRSEWVSLQPQQLCPHHIRSFLTSTSSSHSAVPIPNLTQH